MSVDPKQAIEVYVLLSKSAKGPASARDMVRRAINDNNTFVFGELLELPVMKQIEKDKEYQLLLLFAFGTYMDYVKNKEKFPKIEPKSEVKLKKLTVVTMSSQNKTLSYEMLMKTLNISSTRELEDMLIDCMYQNLLTGKLDQKLGCFNVTSAMNRDVKKEDISNIINRLNSWVNHSHKVLGELKKLGDSADRTFERVAKDKKEHADRIDALEKHVKQFRVDDVEMVDKRQRRRRFQP